MEKYKNLIDLYTKTQKELHTYLVGFLSKNDYEIHEDAENYIIGIPKNGHDEIILVAHLDIVGDIPPKKSDITVLENQKIHEIGYVGDVIQLKNQTFKKGVKNMPSCLGADDRNGVYTIVKLIEMGNRPTVIFCHDEEKGGIGSSNLVSAMMDFSWNEAITEKLLDNKFMIQIDRGCHPSMNEVVFYDEANQDFIDFMTKSYTFGHGSFTDIVTLSEEIAIASANVSAWYMNEHTRKEISLVSGLLDGIMVLHGIIKNLHETPSYEAVRQCSKFKYLRDKPFYDGGYYLKETPTPEKWWASLTEWEKDDAMDLYLSAYGF